MRHIAAGVPRKPRKHPPGHPSAFHGIRPATWYYVALNLVRGRFFTCDVHHQVGEYTPIKPNCTYVSMMDLGIWMTVLQFLC